MIIFAVDDEPSALKLLCRAIEEAEPEAEIYDYKNARDTLEAAEQGLIPDIAFLDIDMPGINGIALAKRLKLFNSDLNVIFTTGYEEYALDAWKVRANGYLLKPIIAGDIAEELKNLNKTKTEATENRVRFQTFGNFEVYIDNKPVIFERIKTKEYLAYLVDRGTLCTNAEIAAALWDNEIKGDYIRILRKDLSDTLRAAGCEDILLLSRGKQGIDRDKVDCDYYDWQKGILSAINKYRGEYMQQYSWAEFTHGLF